MLTDFGPKVSRATLALQLEEALRADILSGELRPGQRLRASDIAPRYGVSATPLREALQRLAVEGLVVLDARVGVTVSPISREDLRDVYETRVVLESEALRRCIQRGDDNWVGRVAVALEDLQRLTESATFAAVDGAGPETNKAWSKAHREFDVQLYGASGSVWLLRFIETLSKRCERYRVAAGRIQGAYDSWLDEHEAIYRAVRERDTAEALEVLRKHLQGTAKLVEEQLADVLSQNSSGDGRPGIVRKRV